MPLASDPLHCGTCTAQCATGQVCSLGQCKSGCDAGLAMCGAGCVDTHGSDPHNCGGCGTQCAAGQVCNAGVCQGCPSGQAFCASTNTCVAAGACATGTGGAGGTAGTGGMAGTAGMGGSLVAAGGMGAQGGTLSAGGMGAVAGMDAGGSAGMGSTGTTPDGYWSYKDWHGCAWTGIDTDTTASIRTTIAPQDFTMGHNPSDPYCVKGAVGNTYESVALLGFNLNQPADGTSCVYDPAAASSKGPPGVTFTGTGLAINFSKKTASTLRVQIQGPDGATDENDRWCYTITDAAGPVFAPYSMFNTKCWDGTGTNYDGTKPISAVVFLVPGVMDKTTDYDFCINGFADGNSAADAPEGGGDGGPLTGTIGGSGSTDLDFQRVKVKVDGHSYIIQNNNWGNPGGSDQTLSYSDNSFKVVSMNGSGSSAPASFPSIFIGANGDTQNGTFSTSSDDHLPIQVSSIQSVMTTFKYSLGQGEMNAAFDIWFSASKPTSCYGDAISGFVMLWFHKPGSFNPIGGSPTTTATIGNHSWQVYVGQRGGTGSSNGTCSVNNSNAPVVSYVASPEITDWSGDLKPFFADAASHGIQASWYLTDVFGGFEIWNGGTGAEVKEFTAVVSP